GVLGNGSTYTRTFSSAGSFPYRCTVHATMVASLTVKPPGPVVAITNPRNGAVLPVPANFVLIATASDSDGAITNVEFFEGSVSLTNETAAPYQIGVSDLPVGNFK